MLNIYEDIIQRYLYLQIIYFVTHTKKTIVVNELKGQNSEELFSFEKKLFPSNIFELSFHFLIQNDDLV